MRNSSCGYDSLISAFLVYKNPIQKKGRGQRGTTKNLNDARNNERLPLGIGHDDGKCNTQQQRKKEGKKLSRANRNHIYVPRNAYMMAIYYNICNQNGFTRFLVEWL